MNLNYLKTNPEEFIQNLNEIPIIENIINMKQWVDMHFQKNYLLN